MSIQNERDFYVPFFHSAAFCISVSRLNVAAELLSLLPVVHSVSEVTRGSSALPYTQKPLLQ